MTTRRELDRLAGIGEHVIAYVWCRTPQDWAVFAVKVRWMHYGFTTREKALGWARRHMTGGRIVVLKIGERPPGV